MNRTSALLARGKDGHTALLRFLGDEAEDGDLLEWFYSDRAIYVVAREEWDAFVASRGAEWTAFLVAVLDGMSRRPEEYEESVGQSEFLVHQFARLPGALPVDQADALTRAMRSAVGRWPTEEPARAPSARGLLEGVLVAWAPRIPQAHALELLRRGGLSLRETFELLKSVHDTGIPGGDLSSVLVGLAEYGGDALWGGIAYAPWAIPQDAVARTDRLVLEDAQSSPYTDYAKLRLARYFRRTERAGWPAVRPIVEEGLAAAGRAPERFAEVMLHIDPKPDREYVRWVLARFAIPSEVSAQLRAAFQLD